MISMQDASIFKTALEAQYCGVILLDMAHRIVLWNRWMSDMSGFASEFAQGRMLADVFPAYQNERLEHAIFWALSNGLPSFISQSLNRYPLPLISQGRQIAQNIHVQPLVMEGDERYCLINIFDVTDLVQKEHRLRDKTEQLSDSLELVRKARADADEANRLNRSFLATMSHEIRTPMNAIIGLTHLCLQTVLTSQQSDYLHKVDASAQSLLGIINDILDFSKIEANRLELENIPFTLADIVENMEAMFAERAKNVGLELQFSLQNGLPMMVSGDPLRLGQVLTNLISNAMKFTRQGGVYVNIALVDESDKALLLSFVVRDTGIGMTEEQMSTLFQAFIQADSSITRRFGGTGLGLAISKRLVEMMGGQISVESQLDVGSCFNFTVRMDKFSASPDACVLTHQRNADAKNMRFSGARVLLVEDNKINQQVARELLERTGVRVTIADHGQHALELLTGAQFDCVLMDMQMPVMDGLTATRAIRSQAQFKQLPIVAMTANAMTGDKDRCLEAGMNDHIGKPIKINELYLTLARYLSPSKEELPAEQLEKLLQVDVPTGFSVLPQSECIDVHSALQALGGNESLYVNILTQVYEQYHDIAPKLRAFLSTEDGRNDALYIVHTLKGLAGNVGAKKLAQSARNVEESILTMDDSAVCLKLCDLLEVELSQVLEAIVQMKVANEPEVIASDDALSIETMLELICQARTYLENSDIDADVPIGRLHSALAGGEFAAGIARVKELHFLYDCDGALRELALLEQRLRKSEGH